LQYEHHIIDCFVVVSETQIRFAKTIH